MTQVGHCLKTYTSYTSPHLTRLCSANGLQRNVDYWAAAEGGVDPSTLLGTAHSKQCNLDFPSYVATCVLNKIAAPPFISHAPLGVEELVGLSLRLRRPELGCLSAVSVGSDEVDALSLHQPLLCSAHSHQARSVSSSPDLRTTHLCPLLVVQCC